MLKTHELNYMVFIRLKPGIILLLFIYNIVDMALHRLFHIIFHAVPEKEESVILRHAAELFIYQVYFLFPQTPVQQHIYSYRYSFFQAEYESGIWSRLLYYNAGVSVIRASYGHLAAVIKTYTLPGEKSSDPIMPFAAIVQYIFIR